MSRDATSLDSRFRGNDRREANLVIPAKEGILAMDDPILHLSIFARGNGRSRNASSLRMEQFSKRRGRGRI